MPNRERTVSHLYGARQREVAPRSTLRCAVLHSAWLVGATTRDHAVLEVAAARMDIDL